MYDRSPQDRHGYAEVYDDAGDINDCSDEWRRGNCGIEAQSPEKER
jgi:hypothetical protein